MKQLRCARTVYEVKIIPFCVPDRNRGQPSALQQQLVINQQLVFRLHRALPTHTPIHDPSPA
jgi:hypothetical protein